MNHTELARSVLASKPVLVDKLVKACAVDATEAPQALREVLRFLDLCAANGQPLTPSPRVDDAWHEFVLCTRLYRDFCEDHFGRFIHHDPGGSDDANQRQFRQTLHLYAQRFGAPDPSYWGQAAADIPTADCGGCESG